MTLKLLASAAIVASTFLLLRTVCYFPYECNHSVKISTPLALAAVNSADPFTAVTLARRSEAIAEQCIDRTPLMIDSYMIAAVDSRVLGNPRRAWDLYQRALQYDHRPELYLQLGLTGLELNRGAEAEHALELAIEFSPSMIEEVADPALRQRLAEVARKSSE